jgi:hypothetical protein
MENPMSKQNRHSLRLGTWQAGLLGALFLALAGVAGAQTVPVWLKGGHALAVNSVAC